MTNFSVKQVASGFLVMFDRPQPVEGQEAQNPNDFVHAFETPESVVRFVAEQVGYQVPEAPQSEPSANLPAGAENVAQG